MVKFNQVFSERYEFEFFYDIRCISHIFNIIVQDILKDYISNEEVTECISNYTNLNIPNLAQNEEVIEDEEFKSKSFINKFIYSPLLINL